MAFWRNYVHLVWTTKNRQLFINETIEPRLYGQMVNKASEMNCYVHALNSMPDHVHLVLAIPPKLSVAEVVKTLKGSSSYFVNQVLRPAALAFEWQRGYGCFSLGHSQLARAVAYVELQKEHHALHTTNAWLERTSESEEGPAVTLATSRDQGVLREHGIVYDPMGDLPF